MKQVGKQSVALSKLEIPDFQPDKKSHPEMGKSKIKETSCPASRTSNTDASWSFRNPSAGEFPRALQEWKASFTPLFSSSRYWVTTVI